MEVSQSDSPIEFRMKLTYMSIHDVISVLVENEKLFCLDGTFPGDETPRTVFVSKEIYDDFCEPWEDTRDGNRRAQARAVLDGFIAGDFITVSEDPFKKNSRCILARIAPVQFEVWDFRCLDPNPGIRIFGHFAEKDTFVALHWDYRENLDEVGDFDEAAKICLALWENLFGQISPYTRGNLSGYLSYNFEPV